VLGDARLRQIEIEQVDVHFGCPCLVFWRQFGWSGAEVRQMGALWQTPIII